MLLKLIAIVAMTFDHWFVITQQEITLVGRLAFPLFAYLLVYNFLYRTNNQKSYIVKLLILATLSQPFFFFATEKVVGNVVFELVFGLMVISAIQKEKLLAAILQIPIFMFFEFSFGGLGLIVGIFFYLKYKNYTSIFLTIGSLMSIMSVKFFYAIPVLLWLFYDAKKIDSLVPYKKWSKYLFYVYYPLHFLVLMYIASLISA